MEIPRPADGVFLAQVLSAGVCGTDLQVLRGEREVQTSILGHEGLLQILEVLAPDCPFETGDRVVVNPTHPSVADLVVGHTRDGLFAQYFYGRRVDIDASAVLSVPDRVSAHLAALVEPIAVALLAMELTRSFSSSMPNSAVVLGAGTIGLCIARVLALSGTEVTIVDNSPSRVQHVTALRWPRVQATTGLEERRVEQAFLAIPPRAAIGVWETIAPLLVQDAVVDFVCDIPRVGEFSVFHDVRRSMVGGRRIGNARLSCRTRNGTTFVATGHRGVGSRHMQRAIELLAEKPEEFRPLVTHHMCAASFCRAADDHVRSGCQTYQGREWIKMTIDWGAAP